MTNEILRNLSINRRTHIFLSRRESCHRTLESSYATERFVVLLCRKWGPNMFIFGHQCVSDIFTSQLRNKRQWHLSVFLSSPPAYLPLTHRPTYSCRIAGTYLSTPGLLPLSVTTSDIYRHRHAQSSEREIYQAIHSNEGSSSVTSECSKENITPM